MKKMMYYAIVVFTFVLMLPFPILATILWLYSRLMYKVVRKLSKYVRDAAKMPKWYDYFAKYIVYITDFTV